jgi:hypothetical protein
LNVENQYGALHSLNVAIPAYERMLRILLNTLAAWHLRKPSRFQRAPSSGRLAPNAPALEPAIKILFSAAIWHA